MKTYSKTSRIRKQVNNNKQNVTPMWRGKGIFGVILGFARHLNRTGTSSKPASVQQLGQGVGLLSRILLTLPETVASGGCRFSKLTLRHIKNTLRAMVAQNGFAQGHHFSLFQVDHVFEESTSK